MIQSGEMDVSYQPWLELDSSSLISSRFVLIFGFSVAKEEPALKTSLGVVLRLEKNLTRDDWKISILEEYPTQIDSE